MQHSPSGEAKSSYAGQEFARNLWNRTIHYNIHKDPQPVPSPNRWSSYSD